MTKLAQVIAFGGQIVQVAGTYNDAANLALQIAREMGFYLAGDYAFRVEGQKTAAFELVEQMHYQSPDLIVIPMGCGTNIASYAKGFVEYRQVGFIDKMPQLIGVQAEGAAAIVHSYAQKSHTVRPLDKMQTIASAIAVAHPIDGIKALDAIYLSNGSAVSVTDAEILQAKSLLSSAESLFVESASAATIAALIKMNPLHTLSQKKVVCILTGDGLKDAHLILQAVDHLPTITPEDKEFMSMFNHQGCLA
jgi:threonine synthase